MSAAPSAVCVEVVRRPTPARVLVQVERTSSPAVLFVVACVALAAVAVWRYA